MRFTFLFDRFPFFAVLLFGLTILLQGCFKDKNATEEVCDNTCQYAYDGECDDGGPNSQYSLCDCGTDCADCGTREVSDNDCLGGTSSSSSSSGSSSSGSSSSGGSSSSSSGSSSSSSSSGSSSSGGSSSSSSSGGPVSCGSTVTDIDGNTYQVVQIGNQCWMKSNLRTKRFRDGSTIPEGSPCNIVGGNDWAGFVGPYWCYPGCDVSNLSRDGLLYTMQVMTDARGICPNGWHVPSRDEYQELIDYLDEGTVGIESERIAIPKLKATSGWFGYDWNGGTGNYSNNGTNSSGFTAYPATQVRSYNVGDDGLEGYWYYLYSGYAGGVGALEMRAVVQWMLNGSTTTEGELQEPMETGSCRCVKD